ncbi:MAG: ABC transporter ATP-binding protein [Myxococcota bacterium]
MSDDAQSLDALAKADEHPVTAWRLMSLALPQLPTLAAASLALVISSAIQLAYPQAVALMTDMIVGPGQSEGSIMSQSTAAVPSGVSEWLSSGTAEAGLDTLALILVVLFLVQAVFAMLRSWLFTVAGERVVADLRGNLYSAIIRQDIGFFDTSRTGELTNRLSSDTTVLQNTVTVNVSMGLRFTIMAIGGLVMMLVTSPMLTGIAMAVVPVVAVGAAVYGRVVRRLSKQVQDALADSTQVAEETLSGVRTVRAFAREDQEVGRYNSAVNRSFRLAAKRALASGLFQGVAGFGGFGALALVVWFGGHLVLDGDMSIGALTAFLLYTMSVAMGMGALSGLYGDFMKAIGASKRVFHLLDLEAPLEDRAGRPVEAVRGDVALNDVHFTYPARPDEPVLRGLNLRIRPGEVVALVGPSGSGKSTVASLLCRFYDPSGGVLTIDDQDVRELDTHQRREQVGLVAQEPILFASSITENILYGRPNATEAQVRAAAVAANAATFIEKFDQGMDTEVGERGVRLSGGQKQRIAIARAILKDPAILVLDEATSALDTESEKLVQDALDRLMEGRTTLIIAHRLSTVRDADRVVVLEEGRAVEEGTHDSLMQRTDGRYRALVERQFGEVA